MPRSQVKKRHNLSERFPPSDPCTCTVCTGYCARPGWWSVEQARYAMQDGLGPRMMLELAPDRSFGVLSPAFPGCEGSFALQEFASRGCGFLTNARCELFGTPHQPLECRFCHHDRPGQGPICHAALESDWTALPGRALVAAWCKQTIPRRLLDLYGLGHLIKPQGQRAGKLTGY